MSHISNRPLNTDEVELIESLLSLSISGDNQGIYKSGTTSFSNRTFGGAGTATLGAILWQAYGQDVAAEAAASAVGGSWHVIATQTAVNVATAATGTALAFLVKGTFEFTGAGTIIPSFAQTTAAAAVVSIGSYFKCNRIGSTSVTNIGQWT